MKNITAKIWKILAVSGLTTPVITLAQAIKNPLAAGNVNTVSDIIINITKWLLGLVGILALLALVIGGIRIIGAFGDEEKVRKGKTIIYWAVAGLAVVFLAYAVIITLSRTLGAL
jgi:fumarate reductase subunit D